MRTQPFSFHLLAAVETNHSLNAYPHVYDQVSHKTYALGFNSTFPLPVKGTPTDQLCGVGKQNMVVPLCPQGH